MLGEISKGLRIKLVEYMKRKHIVKQYHQFIIKSQKPPYFVAVQILLWLRTVNQHEKR